MNKRCERAIALNLAEHFAKAQKKPPLKPLKSTNFNVLTEFHSAQVSFHTIWQYVLTMIRHPLRCLTVLWLVLGLWGCTDIPTASSGKGKSAIVDLRDQDLAQKTVALNAPWDLYWDTLLAPEQFAPKAPPLPIIPLKSLPKHWDHVIRNGQALPDTGCATYHLTVLVDTAKVKTLSLSVREEASAYALWANGALVAVNGKVATTRQQEISQMAFRMRSIPAITPRIDLVLQVSNFHFDDGGMFYTPRIGSPEAISRRFEAMMLAQAICLGMLLLFAFQYLVTFFITRPRSWVSLDFALYCLAWGAVVLCENGDFRFLSLLFPNLSFDALHRIHKFAFALVPPLTLDFCRRLFPWKLLDWLTIPCLLLCSAFALTVIFTPPQFFGELFDQYLHVTAPFLLVLLAACLRGFRQEKPGSAIIAIGFLAMSAAAVNDTLYLSGAIRTTYVATFGIAAMVLSQAVVLSMRTAHVMAANENLLEEVQAKNTELERMAKIKDEFLANTSHELRTPLHGIIGIAESLLNGPSPASSFVRENVHTIVASAQRLTHLVNDILDFTRLRNRDLEIHCEPVALSPLVHTVMAHFRETAERKGISLQDALPEELPPVLADPDRLVQILFNLIGNAVKFTDAGLVAMGAHQTAGRVEIWVRDSGLGIPVADQARIFEAFEQVLDRRRGGTGLGLSITRKLVELQGGKLTLISAPGEGSTFTFSLPVAAAAVPSLAPVAIPQQPDLLPVLAPNSGNGPTILVIDDEPINLQILHNHLESQGYRPILSESGVHALELIRKHQPTLVILDIMMPDRSGIDVCRDIRAHYPSEALPILFVTARNRMDDLLTAFSAGGDDYIVKPFLREALLKRISLHLTPHQEPATDAKSGDSSSALAHRIMQTALSLWEAATNLTPVEFAEASGIWKIHQDANGWRRAQTLDKYLDSQKVPKNPRWQKVFESARYVEELYAKLHESPAPLETLRALVQKAKES